ncbi:MAG: acylneuraminate cytidylyltransferase family protein [Kiritimatiellia bacterium]|jgi:N-acylneuraminate cytidylyltransferase|nr:acylneuraminate cytidylyltransferase family protein [Kiritimatiellia bacterium]
MRILGLIPARGGSRALPDKNIMLLAGKSLVQRTYECASAFGGLDRIILSTDSEAIITHAREFGLEVPFVRPPEFASDESPMIDVAIHALEFLAKQGDEFDALLLLQPTSPLRTPAHIARAIELLGDNDAVCSVVEVPKEANPYRLVKVAENGFLDFVCPEARHIACRQDEPQAYRREGTIFLARVDTIQKDHSFYGNTCVPFVLEPDETLNIDTEGDWQEAERRLACQNG